MYFTLFVGFIMVICFCWFLKTCICQSNKKANPNGSQENTLKNKFLWKEFAILVHVKQKQQDKRIREESKLMKSNEHFSPVLIFAMLLDMARNQPSNCISIKPRQLQNIGQLPRSGSLANSAAECHEWARSRPKKDQHSPERFWKHVSLRLSNTLFARKHFQRFNPCRLAVSLRNQEDTKRYYH